MVKKYSKNVMDSMDKHYLGSIDTLFLFIVYSLNFITGLFISLLFNSDWATLGLIFIVILYTLSVSQEIRAILNNNLIQRLQAWAFLIFCVPFYFSSVLLTFLVIQFKIDLYFPTYTLPLYNRFVRYMDTGNFTEKKCFHKVFCYTSFIK